MTAEVHAAAETADDADREVQRHQGQDARHLDAGPRETEVGHLAAHPGDRDQRRRHQEPPQHEWRNDLDHAPLVKPMLVRSA